MISSIVSGKENLRLNLTREREFTSSDANESLYCLRKSFAAIIRLGLGLVKSKRILALMDFFFCAQ